MKPTAATDSAASAAPRASAAVLAAIVVGTAATAAIGSWASLDARSFYASLMQPEWAPPAAVFGPVWTLLFVIMAAAAWRVARRAGATAARPALGFYAVQLGLNALWSWLFFGWHLGAAASLEVVVLLGMVVATLIAFRRHDALAGWLMAPYAAWVAFASVLTVTIWRLNPGAL